MIRVSSLTKHYRMGDSVVRALDGVDLDIERGEYVATAYWKGERWARGSTPDEAARRVMSKVAAVALFYDVRDTVRYKELSSELSDYVARGMPALDCDDLCAWQLALLGPRIRRRTT